MEESINKSVDKNGNKNVTYTKRWEDNGFNLSKEIRQVEGGWIIRESKYGKPKDGGEDAKYVEENKEYVTTENPFKPKEDKEEKMFDFVDKPSF
jgi:hypothetical protein